MGTRGAWSTAFLAELGNNGPSEDTVKLVSAWTKAENTKARYNPLATTLEYGRFSKFNTANVKNYTTWQEGVEASVHTLQGDHAGYSELREALITNDVARALASFGFDTWGSHTSAVALIYSTQDTRDEPLLSDTGTNAETIPDAPDKPTTIPDDYQAQTPTSDAGVSIDTISDVDIRNLAKIGLGVFLISVAALVGIITIMKTDTAQTVAKTAIKAAI